MLNIPEEKEKVFLVMVFGKGSPLWTFKEFNYRCCRQDRKGNKYQNSLGRGLWIGRYVFYKICTEEKGQ